tara:strand:- start:1089 stop:2330 length:1242 start_codon:yes stop_codon:yes gene_type:complete
MKSYKEISQCRICGSSDFVEILSLGQQTLTGVFPKSTLELISNGPLELIWCQQCGLLQLKQSYSLSEMYGNNYGYHSSLNKSMADHLANKVKFLESLCPLSSGDIVLDIGCNDGTLLNAYEKSKLLKVGVDPTAEKFKKYYSKNIELIQDYFPSSKISEFLSDNNAKIITSIAMFYDLEDPKDFVKSVSEILHGEGIWHFEQHYMPSMLRTNAYDSICHEHLEYYSLHTIMPILNEFKLKIIDVQINDINGGSFAVTVCHCDCKKYNENKVVVDWLLHQEERMGLRTPKPYRELELRVFEHRIDLKQLISSLNRAGKKIIGYGASTKGNVLLQFCGITNEEIPYIAEINEDKFGRITPGTHIPIISEKEAHKMKPDYFLVLPWHFKNSILQRENDYINRGGKFIFPLPYIEII